jgi:hypothetical protein
VPHQEEVAPREVGPYQASAHTRAGAPPPGAVPFGKPLPRAKAQRTQSAGGTPGLPGTGPYASRHPPGEPSPLAHSGGSAAQCLMVTASLGVVLVSPKGDLRSAHPRECQAHRTQTQRTVSPAKSMSRRAPKGYCEPRICSSWRGNPLLGGFPGGKSYCLMDCRVGRCTPSSQ